MARYDDDTKKFMSDVGNNAKFVARQVLRGKPLSQAIARQAIAGTTFSALEKQAGLKVMDIFKLLNSHYDHSWWDWEPETIWQTIMLDHAIEATEEVRNIIQALQVVVSTDAPFEHWHIFEKVGHAFNHNHVSFADLQPLEMDDIAATYAILHKIRPKAVCDDEILGYIAACAKEGGLVSLPVAFFPAGSQESLDKLGNEHELDEEARQIQANKMKTIANHVAECA